MYCLKLYLESYRGDEGSIPAWDNMFSFHVTFMLKFSVKFSFIQSKIEGEIPNLDDRLDRNQYRSDIIGGARRDTHKGKGKGHLLR